MKKVICKASVALILTVSLFGCAKKTSFDNPFNQNGTISMLNTTDPVTAPNPFPSIGTDLSAPSPNDSYFTIATQAEYNALDYRNQIYYTGVKNAVQYLFQSPANQSATIQLNPDAAYSIVVNANPSTSAAAGSCTICGPQSMRSCLKEIKKRIDDNGGRPIAATVTISTHCPIGIGIEITFIPLSKPRVSPTEDGGTLVETFTPPITYSNAEFESYIQSVKTWIANHIDDPIVGGSVPHPFGWKQKELLKYISIYDSVNNTNDVFLTQLEYYVINTWQPMADQF